LKDTEVSPLPGLCSFFYLISLPDFASPSGAASVWAKKYQPSGLIVDVFPMEICRELIKIMIFIIARIVNYN
jgi:hypothetical protein